MNGRADERKDENYIPRRHKCQGYKYEKVDILYRPINKTIIYFTTLVGKSKQVSLFRSRANIRLDFSRSFFVVVPYGTLRWLTPAIKK